MRISLQRRPGRALDSVELLRGSYNPLGSGQSRQARPAVTEIPWIEG